MMACHTIQNLKYKGYSVLMLLVLAWLTVSLPFVYATQQAQKEIAQKQHTSKATDTNDNSQSNTTEEKTETGVNTIAEYLHEVHHTEHPTSLIVTFYKCHLADVYLAFHPDLICPPPDALAS